MAARSSIKRAARERDLPGLAAIATSGARERAEREGSHHIAAVPPAAPHARSAIAASGLGVSYGARPVWSDATFSLPEGSFTAVLGPNGAGKSTLLRVMLGLLEPSSGSIEVLGRRPRRGSPGIGYVAQGTAFDVELSIRGRDFVGLGLDGHRWGVPLSAGKGSRARGVVDGVLRAVGAQGYADGPMGRLSGGEQQRLLLAQALVGSPQILLLDEPLSNLDVRHQGAMVQLIADVARVRRLTVVLIAHDVNPLVRFVDQVVYVANGRVAVGTPAGIITSDVLSRIYGAPIEVIRDSRGRLFVVGLEEEVSHPHVG